MPIDASAAFPARHAPLLVAGLAIFLLILGSTIVRLVRQMSERKRMEHALAARELELHSLADSSPGMVGSLHLRADGSVYMPYVSPNIWELFGLRPQDVIHDAAPLMARNHPDDAPRVSESIAESARSMSPWREEYRILHPTRGERWMEGHTNPQLHPDGGIVWYGYVHDITERKRGEQALAAREREFRTLAENSPDPIFRYDRGCRRLYANLAVSRILGRPVEELIGKSPADGVILVSEQNKKLMHAIRHVFDSGVSAHIEVDFVAHDGQRSVYHMLLVPEPDALGQVETVLALARDITERQRMEEALRERERRYRGIFDNVLDTLYLLEVTPDGHFRYLEVNPAFENSSGMPSAELVGKLIEETVPEETANIVIAKYRRCIEAGTAIDEEVSLDMPSGHRHYHSTLIPVRDDRGRIHRIVGISRNVTERKQAQELLHAQDQAFRAVAENSPDIIARYDTQCRRVYVNPAMQVIFGLPLNAILDKTSIDLLPLTQVFSATYLESVREVLQSGQEQQKEFSFHTIRGEACWGHTRLVPELARDGSVASVLAVTRDITSLKATEARLEESRRLLRQLAARNEAVREDERKRISREIHDELGQYLQALRMEVSLVDIQFGADNPPMQEQTQRLLEMVDATIKVVRNVVASLRPAALDMGIVSALEWLVAEYSGRTGLQFQLQVGEEDIELGDSCTTALFRIVQESLTNVVRHAQASKVTITLIRNEVNYLLEVRDDGRGFDPMLRKERSFGLVSIRERVLMLGGDVNIASAPGQSTAIQVHIPTHKARSGS